ncbi:hypothetical protein HPB52_024784 [Rhipicephalus sanguineus]|uniref:Tick transposon n=1 Tax=Rhipicephalus sanguineus TaxID=34632 RepID=A0A9D4TDU7_RHISA|nr:hypothetical protein HPB52_024784 [Rhipicephalus sanguineus]
MIAPSRFQPLDQLDEASNSQPADLTIQGPSRPALLSDAPANNPAATGNQVSPHLFAERHALPEHTASGRDTAMEDQESWTVVQNRKLPRPKPPTTPQPQTLFETIMLRPKAFNITQIPPYQFAYRLRLALPQIKGSDIQCRLLTKSNLAVVDSYTEQAAHLLLNLEHLIIDDQIVQFNTYVALREGRIRGVIHRIKGLTEEQLMQGLTSSTHEIVSARPLGMSNTALITFNGTNLPEYVAFVSVAAATTALRKRVNKPYKPAAPYSSPHRNASGKVTQKAQQSQEQNFPSLESDHQTLTPQTRTQSATQPPTQLASTATYAARVHNAPSQQNASPAPQTHPSDTLRRLYVDVLKDPSPYWPSTIVGIDVKKAFDSVPHDTVLRELSELPVGRPKYAKLEDLYGTGLLLPIGDYVEPALQAQNERLKLTPAEGHAISEALAHYTQTESSPKAIHIFTDSQQVIRTLQTRSKLPEYARHILNYAAQLQERSIRHQSKEQLGDASSEETATLIQGDTHDANYRAKVHRRRKLRAKLEEATKHDAPPPRSTRPYEVILRRLQTRSFTTIPVLHKMYPTKYPDPNCDYCQAPANTEHILWECPIHESSRAAFIKEPNVRCPTYSKTWRKPPTGYSKIHSSEPG